MESELVIENEGTTQDKELHVLEPSTPLHRSPWKLATVLAVFLVIGLSGLLVWTFLQGQTLETQKVELEDRIQNPRTGYVAQLAQQQTRVITVTRDRDRLIVEYRRSIESTRRELELTRRQLEATQYRNRELEVRLRAFLRRAPQGSTLESRVTDIDNRVLEELAR